jgi:hypothetical protein
MKMQTDSARVNHEFDPNETIEISIIDGHEKLQSNSEKRISIEKIIPITNIVFPFLIVINDNST